VDVLLGLLVSPTDLDHKGLSRDIKDKDLFRDKDRSKDKGLSKESRARGLI